jgi:hypothetical protein
VSKNYASAKAVNAWLGEEDGGEEANIRLGFDGLHDSVRDYEPSSWK